MRTHLLTALSCATVLAAGVGLAATAAASPTEPTHQAPMIGNTSADEGIIKSVDTKAGLVTMDDGTTFKLKAGQGDDLKAGQRVILVYNISAKAPQVVTKYTIES
jgi:Protein of unknown function (DUF1344)